MLSGPGLSLLGDFEALIPSPFRDQLYSDFLFPHDSVLADFVLLECVHFRQVILFVGVQTVHSTHRQSFSYSCRVSSNSPTLISDFSNLCLSFFP